MSTSPKKLDETFAVLKPDMSVQPVPFTPQLYAELDANFSGFKSHVLISAHDFAEDWSTWEKHPAGDEIVVLLSGSATMVLHTDSGEQSVMLTDAGSYVVVPRNTWHTVRVSEPVRMLFITPGEGTENQEQP